MARVDVDDLPIIHRAPYIVAIGAFYGMLWSFIYGLFDWEWPPITSIPFWVYLIVFVPAMSLNLYLIKQEEARLEALKPKPPPPKVKKPKKPKPAAEPEPYHSAFAPPPPEATAEVVEAPEPTPVKPKPKPKPEPEPVMAAAAPVAAPLPTPVKKPLDRAMMIGGAGLVLTAMQLVVEIAKD